MILDDILAARRIDVAISRRTVPLAALRERPGWAVPRRGFAAALRARRPAVIAEVKKASPSKGVIRADCDAVTIARRYAASGAAALSVLTEPRFFQGSAEDLEARSRRRDAAAAAQGFHLRPYQLAEARAWGADAVLLIAAMLDDRALADLHAAGRELDLELLVEAHDAGEVARAAAAGAAMIGINNRDLHTFITTLETAEALRSHIPGRAGDRRERHRDGGRRRSSARRRLRHLPGRRVMMRAPDPGAALAAARLTGQPHINTEPRSTSHR
ncbi:MAG: indole-3-glycerol phosphate synthase TrpC [Candidatus Binatia bacterium]